MIEVLDKGYVKLVNHLGTDIDVVNSARVSFNKEVTSLGEKDASLINYIVQHKHDSCLRHCVMTFEVYAPLMVARQWYKHVVSSTHVDDQLGWNETSRRYVTEEEEFYIPNVDEWRGAPSNKKQGSDGTIDINIGAQYTQTLNQMVRYYLDIYRTALADGIAPEQARMLLPAYAMYVRWRWTASLNALLHFVSLRVDNHAQWEIQQYAKAVQSVVQEYYPITAAAWDAHRIQK